MPMAMLVPVVVLGAATAGVTAGVVLPPHVPNVWGGAALGVPLSASSHLFAFSGADGPTKEGSGFTGLLTPERYAIQYGGTTLAVQLGASTGTSGENGTLLAASSDAIVVAATGSSAAPQLPAIVLAYQAWNVLVGYAPKAQLRSTAPGIGVVAPAWGGCNLTGSWNDPPRRYSYVVVEAADGSFTAHSTSGSWSEAVGQVAADGSIKITFTLHSGMAFSDHAPAPTGCNQIIWAVNKGQVWNRHGSPLPPAAGCAVHGKMAICHAAADATVFAVAFAQDGSAASVAHAAATTLDTVAVDAVASARLAPLGKLPAPTMVAEGASTKLDLGRINAKVFSVMRVNTLSPEGICHTHWSTPDKVITRAARSFRRVFGGAVHSDSRARAQAPHQGMWLWDSCFHAIGRQVVEPELAWEFLHAMMVSAAPDGHVPIEASPWNGSKTARMQRSSQLIFYSAV
jgi:hypothetical protein